MSGTTGTQVDDEYAALYREHNARLVAYARSLTGNSAVAEDLAAEAHFRVWRRIRAGHVVENPSAYLTTTVRNLAAGLGRAQREVVRDAAELPEDPERAETLAADPEQRASHVDLISRLLKELPERWAKALWYAEVEDLPMEAVGERIGASAGTTAVVLTRARERLRQAFLQSQPGQPANEECEQYWKQMPTLVRATASARRTKQVLDHCEGCEDCRTRMLALTEANTRLPLLLGPALFGAVLGGGAWFLPTAAGAGAAGAAVGAKATGAAAGAKTTGTAARAGSGARHARLGAHARLARHGVSPTKATVYGSAAAAVGIAVAVATMALGSPNPPSHTDTSSAKPTAAALSTAKAPAAATSAAEQAADASSPASTTAAPSTTPSTQQASAADVAAGPESAAAQQETRAADPTTSTSPATTPTPAAAATTPVAPTSSTAAATTVADSPSDAAPSTPSASASASTTPSLAPTPSPSQTPWSPTPSPVITPTGSGPTSAPSSPPSCVFYIYGICVIR